MKILKSLNKNLLYISLCAICIISVILNVYVAVWLCEYKSWLYQGLTYWSVLEVYVFILIYKYCKRNINKPSQTTFMYKNKGKRHEFDCSCGRKIIVYTNNYGQGNTGMGSCKCGAVMHIN